MFSAISHDLRTPITRLRLRVELLEDEAQQVKFNRDLDELELLVKGALQCVKDTDIHENIEAVDLNLLLEHIVEPYQACDQTRVTLDGRALATYPGKPLALKRCIGNLLDNALKYGERAHLRRGWQGRRWCCTLTTRGQVFRSSAWSTFSNPMYGSPASSRATAWGWVSRATSLTHGGELSMRNLQQGGLRVTLTLPR